MAALLRPWVAVAIVASCAGVGVATIGASDAPSRAAGDPHEAVWVRGISPRMIEVTFNPLTSRGMRVAKVAFRFSYEYRARDRDTVRERIENGWHIANSRVLLALKRHGADELKSGGGMEGIASELRSVLDRALFPDGIGRTYEIAWEQVLVQ